jgi:ribosomal protein S18 acetylase RimI-like enzyme
MRIEPITVEMAVGYRKELAQLYFDNVRSNAFHSHYTYEEAYEKMNDLIGHLADNTAIVYGAFDDKEIVGFIWAYVHQFREENRIYVSEIRVKEEYRRHGIGKELLRLIEDKARELGLSGVYLHAEANNSEVVGFYKTVGYCEERIQMRKALSTEVNGENNDMRMLL